MPPVIDATVGGSVANSYCTKAEADMYFDSRIALDPDWSTADSATVLLVMATRTLDALAQPFKTLVPPQGGEPAYYRVRRQWTGMKASATQRLAWPRLGMLDSNGNPLDVSIASMTVSNPCIITTVLPHGRLSGEEVLIINVVGSSPSINGTQTVTVIDPFTFSIPVNLTVAGASGGVVTCVPIELKEAEAEFAGQLLQGDPTLNNDVIVQGLTSIRAGSVSLAFKNNIVPQVIPDAVFNLMPASWLTDELYILANAAEFDVVSSSSNHPQHRRTDGWDGGWQ